MRSEQAQAALEVTKILPSYCFDFQGNIIGVGWEYVKPENVLVDTQQRA